MKIKYSILLLIIFTAISCTYRNTNIVDDNDSYIKIIEIESNYLNKLANEVKLKSVFNYLINTKYHERYKYIFDLYLEDADNIFPFYKAFEIKQQPENIFIYKNIKLIESYTYYGIPVEIHEIPNGNQGIYYFAIMNILNGNGYEILLFNEYGVYLDTYTFNTRYSPERNLYAYLQIQDNIYCLLTILDGNHGTYLTLITINKNKFERILHINLVEETVDYLYKDLVREMLLSPKYYGD